MKDIINGVYTGFNDHGNIHWFDTPQPEDDYGGYDTGSDGGFYGEPNSEGFLGDSNSFGPTTPSAYIDPVQEMIYQDYQRYQNNREFDGIQRTLDAAGLVPVFGIGADLVNAGISAARGNWKDAAMSLGAAVPVAGMAVGVFKLGRKAQKGLTTGSKFFRSKTPKQAEKVLRLKYGTPKGVGSYNKSFHNPKTGRTFNLHKDPFHRSGRGHIDIRRRGIPNSFWKDRPFFLRY